jgi:hypothetical protein
MDYAEFSNVEATIRSVFDVAGSTGARLTGLGNVMGAYYMVKMFGTGGTFDYGVSARAGETSDIGLAGKVTSDEATDYLVGYATGYATFATGSPLYIGGTGAATGFYDVIDGSANAYYGGTALAIAGLAKSINMEYNGFLAGAGDYIDGDN